jgi:hypothetical protein
MILIVQLFAIPYANLQDAIHHVLNQKMLSAMLNVKNPNVKLNALIKDAKCSTAQNVSQSANNLTA